MLEDLVRLHCLQLPVYRGSPSHRHYHGGYDGVESVCLKWLGQAWHRVLSHVERGVTAPCSLAKAASSDPTLGTKCPTLGGSGDQDRSGDLQDIR
jgi:hypothetical protein